MYSVAEIDYALLKSRFNRRFNQEPRIFRSPGRINLIGEHTDYNEGFVMPAGIDREIVVLIAPSPSAKSELLALDLNESVSFTETDYAHAPNGWARYIIGVYDQLKRGGYDPGHIQCMFSGNIPMGAGLSSSAALECAALFGYCELFNIHLQKKVIAGMAQKAENQFVGVKCGIMDQYTSVFSKEDCVFKLDCRTLDHQYYPLQLGDYELILIDTSVTHSLASSEYNTRRQQCEEGIRTLQSSGMKIQALRDVTISDLQRYESNFDRVIYKRCKYVVEENMRVVQAGEALLQDDFEKLGMLLYQSHQGLSNEYQVSCPELDFLVEYTLDRTEVLGARMMGGGFGGCTLNLVKKSKAEDFRKDIQAAFNERFGLIPPVYEVHTASGTSEI